MPTAPVAKVWMSTSYAISLVGSRVAIDAWLAPGNVTSDETDSANEDCVSSAASDGELECGSDIVMNASSTLSASGHILATAAFAVVSVVLCYLWICFERRADIYPRVAIMLNGLYERAMQRDGLHCLVCFCFSLTGFLVTCAGPLGGMGWVSDGPMIVAIATALPCMKFNFMETLNLRQFLLLCTCIPMTVLFRVMVAWCPSLLLWRLAAAAVALWWTVLATALESRKRSTPAKHRMGHAALCVSIGMLIYGVLMWGWFLFAAAIAGTIAFGTSSLILLTRNVRRRDTRNSTSCISRERVVSTALTAWFAWSVVASVMTLGMDAMIEISGGVLPMVLQGLTLFCAVLLCAPLTAVLVLMSDSRRMGDQLLMTCIIIAGLYYLYHFGAYFASHPVDPAILLQYECVIESEWKHTPANHVALSFPGGVLVNCIGYGKLSYFTWASVSFCSGVRNSRQCFEF